MAPNLKQSTAPTSPRSRTRKQPPISAYIPDYLSAHVMPYHGDFAYTPVFHPRLITQLMAEGFLPIATDGLLLPKLHQRRCVIRLPQDLHISRSVRKKAKQFSLTVNQAFDEVVAGCHRQHGAHCWLYPPLVEAFRAMHTASNNVAQVEGGILCPVRLYSIEIWNDQLGELAGGELGYSVGSIYTSLTGFAQQSSAGSVQLAALGQLLSQCQFTLWDLGMEMDYKTGLGSHLMPRDEFVQYVKEVRHRDGAICLSATAEPRNARTLIDSVPNHH